LPHLLFVGVTPSIGHTFSYAYLSQNLNTAAYSPWTRVTTNFYDEKGKTCKIYSEFSVHEAPEETSSVFVLF
jgi:uncharacterized protein RhaS with RHS repeats